MRETKSQLSIMQEAFSSGLTPPKGTLPFPGCLTLLTALYSCGDYASGTNHTLPTNGYARQFSGVNTLSFQKHITSQEITPAGLSELGPVVATLADCEGLQAHANAVRIRLRVKEP